MAYQISWYIEPRVLYSRLSGEITLDIIEQQSVESIAYLQRTTRLVHLIMDGTQIDKVPLNAFKIRQAQAVLDQPNLGWMIIITNNATVNFLGNLVTQMVRKNRVRIMTSIEEALAFLEEQDQTIDWALADEGIHAVSNSNR